MLLHYILLFFLIYIYMCVKSLQDPIAIQHMAMHVMFRRDLNELKVSRKAERPNVWPRVGLSAFAYIMYYMLFYIIYYLYIIFYRIYYIIILYIMLYCITLYTLYLSYYMK
jgi:hypothetical protein